MEDENWREHLDEHLLACLTQARRTELDRLQVQDVCQRVFYSTHRVVLLERFDVSYQDISVGRMGRRKTDQIGRAHV